MGGFLAGSAVGGFGAKLIYERVIMPAVAKVAEEAKAVAVQTAKDRCEETMTAAISVAAEKAKVAERERLQEVHEKALESYKDALIKNEAALEAKRQEQQKRDRHYVQQLSESGRSCPLNSGDIEYLNGLSGDETGGAPD